MPPLSHVITTIGNLSQVPINLLVEEVVDGSPFTGGGSLTRPDGPIGVAAHGIAWSFVAIPEHLGVRLGIVPMWEQRLLQLALYRSSRTADHPMEVIEVHHDAGVWLWQAPAPTHIGYALLPGVVCQFRWLLFTFS